jgi:hypothetical protein
VRVRPDAPRPGGPGGPGRPGGPRPLAPLDPDELTPLSELGGRVKRAKPAAGDEPTGEKAHRPTKDEPKRRQGRLTISAALGDDEERQRSYAAVKRARERERDRRLKMAGGGSEKVMREVILPESITVADLANRMSERQADVVKFMMQQGELVRSTDVLDADTAQLIVEEFGHTVKRVAESDVEIGLEGTTANGSTWDRGASSTSRTCRPGATSSASKRRTTTACGTRGEPPSPSMSSRSSGSGSPSSSSSSPPSSRSWPAAPGS